MQSVHTKREERKEKLFFEILTTEVVEMDCQLGLLPSGEAGDGIHDSRQMKKLDVSRLCPRRKKKSETEGGE